MGTEWLNSLAGRLRLPVLALPLRDAEHTALCQQSPQGHHQTHGQQGRLWEGVGC